MDKELGLLLPMLDAVALTDADGVACHRGRFGKLDIVACKCGIGKVNAALAADAVLRTFHPDMVINTGVAGGTGATDRPVGVLDVVLADRIAYHDVWCGPGTVPAQADNCPVYFTCPLTDDVADALGVRRGLIASGDIFIDNPDDLRRVLTVHPDALAVDMESAAIAQACYRRGVPFVCLRVVSDTPGDGGNAAAYEEFWTDAPARTFQALEHLLEML